MNTNPKVIFNDVSKKYTLQKSNNKLREFLFARSNKNSFYALRNVSFTVNKGESIGIIGINGSGKSTLSNLLAQVVPPTSGEIMLDGEPSLIAIAVGLNNNLTGLENIELKCLMHGMKKEEIKEITPLIIDFAELGDFIDQPVKNYSSGMRSRLGFSISAHTNPDIMIIDEALSVGDPTFTEKCLNRMNKFKEEGKTIFFISHSTSQIRAFCDKVIWLHYGEIIEYGNTSPVLNRYKQFIADFNQLSEDERRKYKKEGIAGQRVDKAPKAETLSRARKATQPKEKKTKGFLVELVVLFMLFILSAVMMVTDNEMVLGKVKDTFKQNSLEKSSKPESHKEKEVIPEGTEVNQTGFIISSQENLYSAPELKETIASVNFMEEVFVKNQVGDLYEVNANGKQAYINKNKVQLKTGQLPHSDLKITDILPALPTTFQSSYHYFLSFIDADPAVIEEKVFGKTGEENDTLGNRILNFASIKYRINSENKSDAIIIEDVNPANIDLNLLAEMGTIKSPDLKSFFFRTDTHDYVLNLNTNTIMIQESNED
jgi:teichoic acid transport system ATP-binding protein